MRESTRVGGEMVEAFVEAAVPGATEADCVLAALQPRHPPGRVPARHPGGVGRARRPLPVGSDALVGLAGARSRPGDMIHPDMYGTVNGYFYDMVRTTVGGPHASPTPSARCWRRRSRSSSTSSTGCARASACGDLFERGADWLDRARLRRAGRRAHPRASRCSARATRRSATASAWRGRTRRSSPASRRARAGHGDGGRGRGRPARRGHRRVRAQRAGDRRRGRDPHHARAGTSGGTDRAACCAALLLGGDWREASPRAAGAGADVICLPHLSFAPYMAAMRDRAGLELPSGAPSRDAARGRRRWPAARGCRGVRLRVRRRGRLLRDRVPRHVPGAGAAHRQQARRGRAPGATNRCSGRPDTSRSRVDVELPCGRDRGARRRRPARRRKRGRRPPARARTVVVGGASEPSDAVATHRARGRRDGRGLRDDRARRQPRRRGRGVATRAARWRSAPTARRWRRRRHR